MSATDRDDGNNGKVIYSLLYTVDVNSKFLVNRDTGSITTNAKLDFEQIRHHILYIKAEDQGRPVRTCKFTDYFGLFYFNLVWEISRSRGQFRINTL